MLSIINLLCQPPRRLSKLKRSWGRGPSTRAGRPSPASRPPLDRPVAGKLLQSIRPDRAAGGIPPPPNLPSPSMTFTERTSDSAGERIFSELGEYRAISRLAVGSLVVGLLSALALLGPILWMVPLFALVLGLLALVVIQRSRGGLVGVPMALAGLCLAICFGSAALTDYFNARRIVVPPGPGGGRAVVRGAGPKPARAGLRVAGRLGQSGARRRDRPVAGLLRKP